MNPQTIKGFRDFTGEEASKRAKIKSIIEESFRLYGFEPAETPIIESEEFVVGDNSGDEAVRDVFKLEDRGKRKLALRYEFTFQLKRIAKNQKLPYKRFQIGSVFRDEPIRQGRTRQFIQCDADIIGSTLKDDAECLALGKEIFSKLKIPTKTYVNNRKLINEILVGEGIDERYRTQVIRELDKLDKLSKKEVADNLKKLGAEKLVNIFTQKEDFFRKYKFYKEIKELKNLCKGYGIEVEFRPYLARGFSYYNSSVFEFWSDKLKVALCGGGAFLVGKTQAVGISFGLEPITILSKIQGEQTKVQIISSGQDSTAIGLAKRLREKGISTNLILDKTIGKAMEYANSKRVEYVVIVGDEEVKKGKMKLKNMKTGKEEFLDEGGLVRRLG